MCLAFVLCLGVCAAQGSQPGKPRSQAAASGRPPHGQLAPAPRFSLSGLNSLQGVKVARIQIKSLAVEHPEWLVPLLLQKINEPLDKYKVRQSVQALYNTGRFAEIQVEAQRNPRGEIMLTFSARENFFFGSILRGRVPARPVTTSW